MDQLAPLGLQKPFFDMGHRGLPFLIRQAVHGLKVSFQARRFSHGFHLQASKGYSAVCAESAALPLPPRMGSAKAIT